MEPLEKKLLDTWGLEPASLVSVNRHATHSTIMHPPKKDGSRPDLSNTIFPIRPNVNSPIVIDAIFVM